MFNHQYARLFTVMMAFITFSALPVRGEEPLAGSIKSANPAIPHPRQLRWQAREFTAFVHFGVNTFTDREWGEGTEDPACFNPTQLDATQWVKAFKDAGMKLVIITAKHHDGFCLWPSKYTNHSVKNSPWKEGQGDVVGELAKACREAGLEFGVYLSPWDRHEPAYGDSPRYNEHYLNQLTELLTNYGPIAEVWFDGAPGEDSPLRKKQVYDFAAYRGLVRQLQPDACMFADDGPDCRWVGNERGFAGETCWSAIDRADFKPGKADTRVLNSGQMDGPDWVPAECDVSIRPGWFYHAAEDGKVKTVQELLEIYFGSVGRNGLFLLNVPPDKRGLIHENDVKTLLALRLRLDGLFKTDRAAGCPLSVSTGPEGSLAAYEIKWDKPQSFDVIMLQEDIAQGQRIKSFYCQQWDGNSWQEVARATTVGYKRLVRIKPVTTSGFRLVIAESLQPPVMTRIGLFMDAQNTGK